MKKLFSVLLVLTMVLALGVPAFAVNGPFTLTIPNTVSGYTYDAYQIFKGDVDGSGTTATLSNIEWGSNVNSSALITELNKFLASGSQLAATATATEVADAISGMTAADVAAAIKASGFNGAAKYSVNALNSAGTGYELSMEGGYYFIQNSAVPAGGSYTEYMVQLVETSSVNHKGDVPSVEKWVKDINNSENLVSGQNPTGWVKTADHDIGDTVEYKFQGTLPSSYGSYNAYKYEFKDTISQGLTYNNDIKVYLVHTESNQDVYYPIDSGDYSASTAASGTDNVLTVTFTDLKAITHDKTDRIAVYYTCTLNKNAVVGNPGNPNEVYLTFSNNPNASGTAGTNPTTPSGGTPGEPTNPTNPTNPNNDVTPGTPGTPGSDTEDTPKSKAIVYTYKLTVTKEDDQGNALNGATFKLQKWNAAATTPAYEDVLVDSNGKIDATNGTANIVGTSSNIFNWIGLDDGKYKLIEVTAPNGYNKMADIEFVIDATHDATGITALDVKDTSGAALTSFTATKASGLIETTIANLPGTTLPETGGIGTTPFYVGGAVLLLAAAAWALSKKRKVNE